MVHKEIKTCRNDLRRLERRGKGGKLFAVSIPDDVLINAIAFYAVMTQVKDDGSGRWSILWETSESLGWEDEEGCHPKVSFSVKNRTPFDECSIMVPHFQVAL